MARLSLSLLGTFMATLHGRPVTGFAYDKVRALLAFLAVESTRPYRREFLAGLLWPDKPHRRTNLRQALADLRAVLEAHTAEPPFLLITGDNVQFNPAGEYVLDVAAFTALLASCDTHPHRRTGICTACARRLAQAIDLYQGDFLEQLVISDSEAFEAWLVDTRERLI